MITRNKPFISFMYVLIIFLTLACILPFLLLAMSSITAEETLAVNGYSFFPEKISLDSYKFLWTTKDNMLKAFGISVFVTAVGTCANVLLTTLFAYPLSRRDLPGRNGISLFLFFYHAFQWRHGSDLYGLCQHAAHQKYHLGIDRAISADECLLHHHHAHLY